MDTTLDRALLYIEEKDTGVVGSEKKQLM